MRTLNKNKQKFYKVSLQTIEDEMDHNGNFTGQKVSIYSDPEELWINFRVRTGTITSEVHGRRVSYDSTAVSTEDVLQKDDLLFYKEPDEGQDLQNTYDLRVSEKSPSLNGYQYGLERRV